MSAAQYGSAGTYSPPSLASQEKVALLDLSFTKFLRLTLISIWWDRLAGPPWSCPEE
jgi:hypothetical protein